MGTRKAIDLATPGGRLASERQRLGLTVSDMASLGGIERGEVTVWEGTTYSNSMRAFTAWHRAGVDIVYVITGVTTPALLAGVTAHEAVAILPPPGRQSLLVSLLEAEFFRLTEETSAKGSNEA